MKLGILPKAIIQEMYFGMKILGLESVFAKIYG